MCTGPLYIMMLDPNLSPVVHFQDTIHINFPEKNHRGKKPMVSGFQPGDPARICKVACGENFSAAMSEQGELWVWGRNDYGQLGLGEEAGPMGLKVRWCLVLTMQGGAPQL